MELSTTHLEALLREFINLPGETEWLEFKDANDNFKTDVIGKYFSALSNEANLHSKEFGWLIFGVHDKTQNIIGTSFRNNPKRLNGLKNQIGNDTTNRVSFVEIHELVLPEGRVLMFQIPAAPRGTPVSWKGHFYGREGESLTPLGEKYEVIRRQQKYDWSAEICKPATIGNLSPEAIAFARQKFKEGNSEKSFYEDIDSWDDLTFLNKAKITTDGKITNAALLLLGKPEAKKYLFPNARVTYVYIDGNGEKSDYEHYDPPFLLERDRILKRIKHKDSRFKLLPPDSLNAIEVTRYNSWSILEALNNCIAHQDYSQEKKIVVTEKADYELSFLSAGTFFKGRIEDYIFLTDVTPQEYRNPFLANAMESIGMIDTVGSGIQRIFRLQRDRLLPLPDYYLGDNVELVIHGNSSWNTYTAELKANPGLGLGKVFLLDKREKGQAIDDDDFRYAIISFLKRMRRVTKIEIDEMLVSVLDAGLTERQRKKKAANLLQSLARDGRVQNIGKSTKKPIWTLRA